MLDEKIELTKYFENEIKRVSEIEMNQIDAEISSIRDTSLRGLDQEAQREAHLELEQVLRELKSDHAIAISRAHEETNRKLMKKRRELADEVFHDAIEKIKEFAASKEYPEYLNKKAKAIANENYGYVEFFVGEKDEKYLSAICKAYGECTGIVDPNILIGGFRVECSDKGIVVDETFDAGIDEQKNWFYTSSGLFIK
ncbi:MAG: V-type ATP synthase subunit E [Longicatena sp.]